MTLRWWSTQSAPAQLEAYKVQIAEFEAANPGIKVVFEPTSDEGYAAQLAAAFAAAQVPNIVTHLPSFAVTNYWRNGLLEPFNDVIQAIGPDKYLSRRQPHLRDRRRAVYGGTGIGNTAANMLWLRTRPDGEGRHRRARPRPGTSCAPRAARCRAAASTARRCPTPRTA